ncbi:hypothetical protein RQP46_001745 [Phenoliferia psychrophenolica]
MSTRKPRPIRFALVQFNPIPPDHSPNAPLENLKRAHAFVEQAAEKGANIVVFPEYFISGVVNDEKHWGLAQREHDPSHVPGVTKVSTWLHSFSELAIKHQIDIVAGTIMEKEAKQVDGKDILRNVAHYIAKTGEVTGSYKKANLWHPEKGYIKRGDEGPQVFDTEYGRTGLLICWDVAWPEAFRSLVLQGVEIVICPTFWTSTDGGVLGLSHNPSCEELFLDNLIVSRAFENECAVVFVNAGGPAKEGFIGRSGVTLPFLGKVGGTTTNEEEMVMVDIDLGILEDAKAVYGIRKDLITNHQRSGTLPAGIEP